MGPSRCIDGFDVRCVVNYGFDSVGRKPSVVRLQKRLEVAVARFLVDCKDNMKGVLHSNALCSSTVTQNVEFLSCSLVGKERGSFRASWSAQN